MKKLQFIDIGKPFRIIGKICKDIERAFRFKGINVNFIGMLIDYIGIAFIFKWNLHSEKSQFLGFGFTTRVNQKKRMQYPTQKYFAIVHEKKRTKFIKRIKLILDRRAPGGIEKVKSKLKEYVRGWYNYYAEGIPVK